MHILSSAFCESSYNVFLLFSIEGYLKTIYIKPQSNFYTYILISLHQRIMVMKTADRSFSVAAVALVIVMATYLVALFSTVSDLELIHSLNLSQGMSEVSSNHFFRIYDQTLFTKMDNCDKNVTFFCKLDFIFKGLTLFIFNSQIV